MSTDKIAELVRRGDGNPFFVEQLLAASEVTTLSEELAELLRSRAAATTSTAHDVLRVLAVAGRPLSDDELTTVTGHGADQVRGALRELVGAALARLAADGLCTPRHALLGEAIETGLFAGERAELHGAVADLLMHRADSSLAAEAAHHLRLAGREPDELPVRIMAAEYCEQVVGFAEASKHWSRAVDLAGQLDDGQVAALALRALRARNRAGTGEPLPDQTERGKCAAVRHRQQQLYAALLLEAANLHSPDATMERGLTELQAAVDAFRELPPSTEQVSALIGLYWLHRGAGKPAEGMPHLRRAAEIEKALGNNSVMALATLAHAQLLDGDVESGLAALTEARQRMGADADQESVIRLALAEADTNVKLNRLEQAATDGLADWHRLQANGLTDTYMAAALLSSVGEALRGQGQLDELRRIVEPLTTDRTVGPASWKMHEQRCWADLCGGRLGAVTDRLDQILSRSWQRSFYDRSDIAQLRVELALWSNDPRAAVDVVLPVLDSLAGATDDGWAARLLTSAMWACADLVEDARAGRDDTQARAGQQIAERVEAAHADLAADPFAEHPFFVIASVEGRQWAAELNRCRGQNQPEAWLVVARQWEDLGWPHRAGYAWWRAAQALLHLGQRGPAASALRTAHQRSHQHVPLTDAVTHLARVSRVTLEPAATAPQRTTQGPAAPPMFGLTRRELDVLRLLTEGHTNAEIGSRLYMSPKTASVHVTAILRKLQATNRVHAAAIAERLGVTDT
jgi:DNA-binding CsgD family transcriptional regulator